MKKLSLGILIAVLLAGQCFATNYYVSPSGNGSAPTHDAVSDGDWSGAYPYVQQGVDAATFDGDVVILQNVSNHTVMGNGNAEADITIQNEDGDTDYSKCVISGGDNYYMAIIGTSNKIITIKGITISNQTHTESYAPLRTNAGVTGSGFDLRGVKFSNIVNSRAGYGGIFYITSGILKMAACIVEDCNGPINGYSAGYLLNTDVEIVNSRFSWLGDATTGAIGHIFISCNDETTHNVYIANSTFENISTITADHSAGDGGVFYFFTGLGSTDRLNVILAKNTWQNNIAFKGGAWHAGQEASVTSYLNKYYNNYSYGTGGAISKKANTITAYDESLLSIADTYIGNHANHQGGAIVTDTGKYFSAYACKFYGNTSNSDGETLYAGDHDASGTAKKSSVIGCTIYGVLESGEYHIYGDNDNGFDVITNSYIDGGESAISDAGADTHNIGSEFKSLMPVSHQSADIECSNRKLSDY